MAIFQIKLKNKKNKLICYYYFSFANLSTLPSAPSSRDTDSGSVFIISLILIPLFARVFLLNKYTIAPTAANGKMIIAIINPASGSVNNSRTNIREVTEPNIPIVFKAQDAGLKPAFSCHSGNFFGRTNTAKDIGI